MRGSRQIEDIFLNIRCEVEQAHDLGHASAGTGARTGTRKTIFGHSACAVLKALGRAGLKYTEADAILKRHDITMPKASVSVQLGFGRNEHTWQRHGKPANLTAAQMKELGIPND